MRLLRLIVTAATVLLVTLSARASFDAAQARAFDAAQARQTKAGDYPLFPRRINSWVSSNFCACRTSRRLKTTRRLTAIIEREDDAYVALCRELDIASQGDTVESARMNLVEALELFFESADATEIARRLHGEVLVTQIEVLVG